MPAFSWVKVPKCLYGTKTKGTVEWVVVFVWCTQGMYHEGTSFMINGVFVVVLHSLLQKV